MSKSILNTNYKNVLWLIEQYVFEIPLAFFHELTHWVFCVITWLLDINTFPKIVVVRWPTRCVNSDDTTSTSSIRTHVSYRFYGRVKSLHIMMCSMMPIVGMAALFYFSPWFMWIYYLANINTLWLSVDDTRKVRGYFKLVERARRLRQYKWNLKPYKIKLIK